MAYQLNPEQEAHYKDLAERFDEHVAEYRAEKQRELDDRRVEELEVELRRLEEYLELYHKGEVDDMQTAVRYMEAKVGVLQSLGVQQT